MHALQVKILGDARALRIPLARLLSEAGVAPSTWWRWENDKVGPRLDTIAKLEGAIARRQAALEPAGADIPQVKRASLAADSARLDCQEAGQ